VKVPHSTEFRPQLVKQQLGISVAQWDDFMVRMKTLAERKVSQEGMKAYFQSVICNAEEPLDDRRFQVPSCPISERSTACRSSTTAKVSPATTEPPYPHNSQNAPKPPEPGDSADFADSGMGIRNRETPS
jgi:hypothetical protein